MPWESQRVRYWTVCWLWGFIPYPCRKRKTVYCCTGRWKQRCYLFFGEQWLCCNGREYHYWVPCFGIGDIVSGSERVCRDEIPDATDGCTIVGDAPPGSGRGEYGLTAVNVSSGGVLGGITGALIALVAAAVGTETLLGAFGGAIVGAILGGGSGRRSCCVRRLSLLAIILLIIWLILTG